MTFPDNTLGQEPTPDQQVPQAWQSRFAFFDAYGPPADPPSREAFKHLTFGQRMRVSYNVLAFLFGPIYFAIKGMWRKGLTFFGLSVVFSVLLEILIDIPRGVDIGIGVGIGTFYAVTANYAYYLHVRQGNRSWNIFEGLTRTKS